MADSTDQQELRNIDSGQKGTKSVLDHMRSNCKKCEHMPKVPNTGLLAEENRQVEKVSSAWGDTFSPP